MSLSESEKKRLAVTASIVAPLGAMVAHDKITERKQNQKIKRLNKAERVGQQAVKMSKLAVTHIENARKTFDKGMDEIERQVNTGQTQTPAKGANQNNPPKNVRYMGDTSGGYKMGDPRITDDTYQRFAKKQISKHKRSFNAVKQLNEIVRQPNSQNYLRAKMAAVENKDAPKPKAANTNYTKKVQTAIKIMSKIARGGSAIGALSYAASSTPVSDATIHKGFKYKEFKRK